MSPSIGSEIKLLKILQYSDRYDTVISADENGFVEFWQPIEPFELPKNVPGMWSFKSSTDLYEFKKVCLCSIEEEVDNSCFLGEIDTHVHYPLPRFQLICDILSARPAGPNIFIPIGEANSEIR